MTEIALFDYGQLDVETRITVKQRTEEIKTLVRRSAQDIIDIGNKLFDVKGMLNHGEFGNWIDREFGWSESAALKFMQVAHYFKSINFTDLNFAASALYLLAAPSTPDPARLEALERARAGEEITHTTAKAIVAQHRPAPDPADLLEKCRKLEGWLLGKGWSRTSGPAPTPGGIHKGEHHYTWLPGDRQGNLNALKQAESVQLGYYDVAERIGRTPTPQPSPQRTYESAISAFTASTSSAQAPVERRPPATDRPLTDNEVEAVIWRAIAHHAKSGMAHHRLAWLQTAEVGDFSRLLNPGVSFEAEQLDRIKAKVEVELGKLGAQVSDVPGPATPAAPIAEPAIESEPEPELAPEPPAKDNDENYTPRYIAEAARLVLGQIDLDPASCARANMVIRATTYLTKANNSLQPQVPWRGRVWLNPPFSNPAPFTNKLIEQYETGYTKAAILLTNNGTETQWGQALLNRTYPVCFVGAHAGGRSRIDFWQNEPDEPRTGNRYAQMFFYLGKEPDKFREVFFQFGVIR